jgi:signal transduction histidine kinase
VNAYWRAVAAGAATLVAALFIAYFGATSVLGEPPHAVGLIVMDVAISGGVALLFGVLGLGLGMRFLPRLSLKVAAGYAIGSVAAIAAVAYTPLLMFKDPGDLHLLVLLLVCFLVISVGLGSIIAQSVTRNVNILRDAARRMADGHFNTRVNVPAGDELGELAAAFNRMSAELGLAFDRERAIETGRRDLVAAISHDLQTPLSSIRIMLEAIEDGVVQDAETVTQYHHAMQDQVNRLSRLIDDLFELSRLDGGDQSLNVAQVDLRELVSETVESLRAAAESRRVLLEMEALPGTIHVAVDADKLQRVLANLIQNATRHTPAGGRIGVAIRSHGPEVAVEVSDSGEGIALTDVEHVFDRFYRGEKSRTRNDSSGAGLGLAIAKAIVEAHRGRIWVESEPQHGAKFVFTLPAPR